MHNLSRFSPVAQEVLNMARQEASRLRHAEATPEHLAIALSMHQRSASLSILKELKANINLMQQELRGAAEMAQTGDGFGRRLQRVADLAADEAKVFNAPVAGTEHLLAGIVREGRAAKNVLNTYGVTLYGIHKLIRTPPIRDGEAPPPFDITRSPLMRSQAARAVRGVPVRPSLMFIGLVILTLLAGLALFLNIPLAKLWAIIFVMGGWVVALCLHEFGHAAVAYIGGDSTVVSKGYLTLNPLKYTHPLLSIVLPIVFLLLGGIPLPGGAVYIDRSLISDRRLRSFMSGAGPTANLLFVLFLLIPYLLLSRFDLYGAQNNFWGAYAFLMFLNIFAVVINLLPIPGIDGFGILEPFLPFSWVERARGVLPYTFLILFIVLWTPNPIRFAVLWLVGALTSVLGISSLHISYGAGLFTLFR